MTTHDRGCATCGARWRGVFGDSCPKCSAGQCQCAACASGPLSIEYHRAIKDLRSDVIDEVVAAITKRLGEGLTALIEVPVFVFETKKEQSP